MFHHTGFQVKLVTGCVSFSNPIKKIVKNRIAFILGTLSVINDPQGVNKN